MSKYLETPDDFAKKYNGTYVLYEGVLVFLNHFDGKPGAVSARAYYTDTEAAQGSGQTIYIEPEKLTDLSPNAMYINFGNDLRELMKTKKKTSPCVLFRRSPRRQWKRGLCSENVILKSPYHIVYTALGRTAPPGIQGLSFALLQTLQAPTYPSLKDATVFCDRLLAVAVSPDFCIVLSSLSPDKYLLRSQWGFIGECTKDHIWVKHPPALQEVKDFVNRTQQPIAIEVVDAN